MKRKNYIVSNEVGIPCHRCSLPTLIHIRNRTTARQEKAAYYYSQWYYCNNKECQTTLIMDDEFKVTNRNRRAREIQNYEEHEQQLNFFKSI